MHALGYRIAQLGGALMIVGGMVDMSLRTLLPHHAALLASDVGAVPDEAARLVLALLRALGGALAAAGLAVLVLLRYASHGGGRMALTAAAFVAVLSEGPNAVGIHATGSPLYLAPLTFMLLVVTGCALCLLSSHVRGIPEHPRQGAG